MTMHTLLRFAAPLLAAALLTLCTGVAHAAMPASAVADVVAAAAISAPEGGETKSVVNDFPKGVVVSIMTLVVFSLVLFFLYNQVWPKIQGGLNDRNDKIQGEIEAAELARKQAKDALDEYEKNLAEARAEAQQMLEQTRQQQQQLAAELRAKADTELTNMRQKAQADIEAAKKAAVNEIYAQAANLASLAAGKILQREITPSDQQRLIDESLAELQTKQN
ncbi:MAG: F0F1 ATP synthase subunit B [Planctomycetota bacterium]